MPTERQIALAARLDIDLGDAPEPVATAIIDEAVRFLLTGIDPRPCSAKQVYYAKTLGVDVSGTAHSVASAWIDFKHAARTNSAVAVLALQPGDRVLYEYLGEGPPGQRKTEYTIEEVSSVSNDGMVYFKNPRRGFASAWAVYVRRPTAEELRAWDSPQRHA